MHLIKTQYAPPGLINLFSNEQVIRRYDQNNLPEYFFQQIFHSEFSSAKKLFYAILFIIGSSKKMRTKITLTVETKILVPLTSAPHTAFPDISAAM